MKTPCSIMSDCQHLHNFMGDMEECSGKRFLLIFNPIKGHDEYLVFCNDWLKLKAQEDQHEIFKFGSSYVKSSFVPDYKSTLEKLVLSHIELPLGTRCIHRRNYLSDIFIDIAERPWIFTRIDMRLAMEWYQANRSRKLYEKIEGSIRNWCDLNERYKKHQSNCKLIKSLLIKVRHNGPYEIDQCDVHINEIFLTILKITTNEAN
jgi:hypothetical protein